MVSQKLYPVHFLEYLTSIWTIKLFNRRCDICKDLRIEFPAINSSNMQSGLVTCSLELCQAA